MHVDLYMCIRRSTVCTDVHTYVHTYIRYTWSHIVTSGFKGGRRGRAPPFEIPKRVFKEGQRGRTPPAPPPLLKFQRGSSNGTAAASPPLPQILDPPLIVQRKLDCVRSDFSQCRPDVTLGFSCDPRWRHSGGITKMAAYPNIRDSVANI